MKLKNILLRLQAIIILLLITCTFAQAKTVIEKPCFDGRNNRRLEIEKVTLDKKATYLDIRIYSIEDAGIASQAALYVDGTAYKYLGSPQLPNDEMIKVPECGYISATLKFKPLPEGTKSFDFKEMPDDTGWNIYGVRLDGKRPNVTIPQNLLQQKLDFNEPLPSTTPTFGKAKVHIKLLGYNTKYKPSVVLEANNAFSPEDRNMHMNGLSIKEDGTCDKVINLVLPTESNLTINGRYQIPIVVVPNGNLNITINMPEAEMATTHLFDATQMPQIVWFEGDYASLNTKLQQAKGLINFFGDSFCEDICGMTPLQYKEYLTKEYHKKAEAIKERGSFSTPFKDYVKSLLDMSYISTLYAYKFNLSYAPMLSGKKGVKRADMAIDSTSYFKEIKDMPILQSDKQLYDDSFWQFYLYGLKDRMCTKALIDDFIKGEELSKGFEKQIPLTAEQIAIAKDSIHNDAIREMLFAENQKLMDQLHKDEQQLNQTKDAAASQGSTYKIVDIDSKLPADKIMQTLLSAFQGKVVLVDLWNTWCGPCKNAMKLIKPLKAETKDVVYVYLADESSPMQTWLQMIPTISGTHVRVSSEQAEALGELYNYPGIPTYLIFNKKGEKSYQNTGFPGVDVLKKELEKAAK